MARPLEGRYLPALAAALLALTPFIVLSTAETLFERQIASALGAGRTSLSVIQGLSLAAYAFGALVGGDLTQRFSQRRLFLVCEAGFVLASVLAAVAPGVVAFGTGSVLEGGATGLLLVIALPPVVRGYDALHLRWSAAAIDMAFFGAVTAGPLLGGAFAAAHAWRWFFALLAFVGCITLTLAWLSLGEKEAPNPRMPFDREAIILAAVATFLPFWGTGELRGHGFGSLIVDVPLAVGLACFVALLLLEYHKSEPLSPIKPMWKAVPLTGVLAAMVGGGIFVTALELAEVYQLRVTHLSPLVTGLSLWPMVPGALVASALLGLLLSTRWLPVYALAGMLMLIAGAALLQALGPHAHGLVPIASGLLGLGAGATVSPGLWLVGLSQPSKQVGRTFAVIELVRSEADFILAPVLLEVARVASGGTPGATGVLHAFYVTLVVASAATLFGLGLYLTGEYRLPSPNLETWLSGEDVAVPS